MKNPIQKSESAPKDQPVILSKKNLNQQKISRNFLSSINQLLSFAWSHLQNGIIQGAIISIEITRVEGQINLTISTPVDGQDILISKQSEEFTQKALVDCHIGFSNITSAIGQYITSLCDGSLVYAVENSSMIFNLTTDSSLNCLAKKFNTRCGSDPFSDSIFSKEVDVIFMYTLLSILGICCCYFLLKWWYCPEIHSEDHLTPIHQNQYILMPEEKEIELPTRGQQREQHRPNRSA